MTEVRPFAPDDLQALWALAHLPDAGVTEDPAVPVPLAPRRTPPSGPAELVDPQGTVLAAGGHLLVAVEDGHVVGAGGLRPVRDRRALGRLVRIRVHPARRRAGIGRALMAGLEDAARRDDLTDLLLDVGDHQPEALAFYRALGWSETWRQSGPDWQWETVWFHRSLERAHLAVEVRPCAGPADADAAERAIATPGGDVHRQRWEQQEAGAATYLLAWDGADVVGHVLLLHRSRWPQVEESLGAQPEVSRLRVAERVHRRGVGTSLLGAAAGVAQAQGATTLGLAVDHGNDAASTLCRRLGWRVRPGLTVVDEWDDPCDYWTQTLARTRVSARPQGH